jgi:chorismate--pyruvate lyase
LPSRRPSKTIARDLRRRIFSEPGWRPLDHFTSAVLTAKTRTWLTDDGSLTARLTAFGRGEFRVQRRYQGWAVPLPSERRLLGLATRQLALVREVALLLDEQAVVFARSVFPAASLSGSLAHLRRLQNRSLGAILFRHPGMHRQPFELALMPGDSDYLPADLHQACPAWGRRSRFDIEGKRLMVSEVFLQPFVPWPQSLPVHRSQRGRVGAAIVAPKPVS